MSDWLLMVARPGVPWVGLLAILAMFVLPLLPDGFWEGQRRSRPVAMERPPEPRLDRPVRGVLVRPPLQELEERRRG
jgi:hypothetical protein